MRLNLLPSSSFWTSLFLGLCGLTGTATQATAQLWDVPSLPPVKYAQARDCMTATILLESWYSGEEGGAAIAETLSGKNNPAGRLPITFCKDVRQLPNFEDYSMKGRTYRYFDGEPLWPFGYGFSYTAFTYSNLKLPDTPVNAGDPLHASVTVANTGRVVGDEVLELYLQFPAVVGAPRRALRGFQRVHLEPGASQNVDFQLNPRDLSMVTDLGDITVAKGKYTLSIGTAQPGTGVPSVSANFEIKGQIMLPE